MPPVSHGRRGAVPLTSSHPTSCQVREGGKIAAQLISRGVPPAQSLSIRRNAVVRQGTVTPRPVSGPAPGGARPSSRGSNEWQGLEDVAGRQPPRPPLREALPAPYTAEGSAGRIAAGAVPRPGVGSLEPAPETPPGRACGARPERWTGRTMRRGDRGRTAGLPAGRARRRPSRDDRMARDARGWGPTWGTFSTGHGCAGHGCTGHRWRVTAVQVTAVQVTAGGSPRQVTAGRSPRAGHRWQVTAGRAPLAGHRGQGTAGGSPLAGHRWLERDASGLSAGSPIPDEGDSP